MFRNMYILFTFYITNYKIFNFCERNKKEKKSNKAYITYRNVTVLVSKSGFE